MRLFKSFPVMTYFPTTIGSSIIGAVELNDRGRNGIGCFLYAITTGKSKIFDFDKVGKMGD